MKHINKSLDSSIVKRNNLTAQKLTLEQQLKEVQSKITQLNVHIRNLENSNLLVSDHSIVRYIERVLGIDIEMIKNCILTDSVRSMYKQFGDGKYPVEIENESNCTIVIKSGKIITLYTNDSGQEF